MIEQISIQHLKVDCFIGVYAFEQEKHQSLFLDVDLDYSFLASTYEDDVSKTIDYAEVSQTLNDWMQSRRFKLIETVAHQAIDLLFEKWSTISKIKIKVKKPSAVPKAEYAAVTVERRRPT